MITEEGLIWERFREYTCKIKFLKENPMRGGDFDSYEYEDDNPEHFYKSAVDPKYGYKKIETINYKNKTFFLYGISDNGGFDIKIIPENVKTIVGNISFVEDGDGIKINSVYNQPLYKGIVYYLIFNYFLKKYDFVISGDVQSNKGERFWEKILQFGFLNKEKFKITVINSYTGETYDINNFDDVGGYYGDEPSFEKYRFKIENI